MPRVGGPGVAGPDHPPVRRRAGVEARAVGGLGDVVERHRELHPAGQRLHRGGSGRGVAVEEPVGDVEVGGHALGQVAHVAHDRCAGGAGHLAGVAGHAVGLGPQQQVARRREVGLATGPGGQHAPIIAARGAPCSPQGRGPDMQKSPPWRGLPLVRCASGVGALAVVRALLLASAALASGLAHLVLLKSVLGSVSQMTPGGANRVTPHPRTAGSRPRAAGSGPGRAATPGPPPSRSGRRGP